jgi:hypothetical protein
MKNCVPEAVNYHSQAESPVAEQVFFVIRVALVVQLMVSYKILEWLLT